jgi:hypothetical protein
MISTTDLSRLPDVTPLRRLMQSLAMLEAILCPQRWLRRYYFDQHWSPGKQMSSMDNGGGDHYFALFNAAGGCWIKGFDHESPMSPHASDVWTGPAAGMYEGVPAEFAADCLSEPAFMIEDVTFCIWRRLGDAQWQRGPVNLIGDDGSGWILSGLDGEPQTYRQWAKDYHERDVPIEVVRAIFAHRPLDLELVWSLNDQLTLADLRADIDEIGYGAAE